MGRLRANNQRVTQAIPCVTLNARGQGSQGEHPMEPSRAAASRDSLRLSVAGNGSHVSVYRQYQRTSAPRAVALVATDRAFRMDGGF